MNLFPLKIRPLTIVVSVLAAVALSENFMARRNVLAFKEDWTIAQEGFINPGLNAIPNYIYRSLLTGYRLRSNHLMGTQRIFSRAETLPEKLEADVRLGEDGFVDLIANGTHQSYIGVRISSSSTFPSMVYEADHRGRYLSTSPLPFSAAPGVLHVELSDGKVSAGKDTFELPANFFRTGKAGVQISFKDAELFYFRASGKSGAQELQFFPEGNRVLLYLQTFLAVLMLVFLSGLLPKVRRDSIAYVLLGVGLLGWVYQYVHPPQDEDVGQTMSEFSILDSYWKPGPQTLSEKVEHLRDGRYYPGPYLCRPEGCSSFPENEMPEKRGKRVVLFGGSMFRHSLVKDIHESFHFRFDRAIRKRFPDVETLNINSTGLFRERVEKYQELLPKYRPDVLIIESLSFDHEVDGIIRFIRDWSARGVNVVFLRRPVNPLMLNESTADFHISEIRKGFATSLGNDGWDVPEVIRVLPKYRKAQEEIGYTFLDPNEYLLQDAIRGSGEVFWDGFHFTAYGQQLWAEWLAREFSSLRHSSK